MHRSASRLTWLLIAIVGFLTLCPVFMLALGSFSRGLTGLGAFTLDKYLAVYGDPALLHVVFNTVVFVLGSSILSTVLALFLAYLNTRTDISFKGLFTVLAIVPMMIPHVLFSVSWALLLNPSTCSTCCWWMHSASRRRPSTSTRSAGWCWWKAC